MRRRRSTPTHSPEDRSAELDPAVSTGVEGRVPNPGLRAGGITLIVGGLAVLGGGIAMLVTGATKVTIEQPGAARAAAAKPRYWMGEF